MIRPMTRPAYRLHLRPLRLVLFVPLVLLSALLVLAVRAEDAGRGRDGAETILIGADLVLTAAGRAVRDGWIVVRGGRIVHVGDRVGVREGEPGVRVLRVRGVLAPGLIDCGSGIGIRGRAAEEASEVTPGVRVRDSVDLDHPGFRRALEAGVTTVAVSAGARNVIGGLGVVIRRGVGPARIEDVVLREDAFLDVSLVEAAAAGNVAPRGSPPLTIYYRIPNTRMGTVFLVRRAFGEALGLTAEGTRPENRSKQAPWVGSGEVASPFYNRAKRAPWVGFEGFEVDALAAALRGEIPLRLRADDRREIETAFRIMDEFGLSWPGLSVSIVGAAESLDLVDELARRRSSLLLHPGGYPRGRRPEADPDYTPRLPALLARAHVPFAFASLDGPDVPLLRERVALGLRHGLDEATALHALTLGAARILGIDRRTGSIERGKDADLVLLAGDPFTPDGRAEAVFVDGELVHHEGPTEVAEGTTIILARRVHDGKGGEHPAGIVLVKGGKVRYVGPGPLAASLGRPLAIVDASRATVIPGLIDGGSSAGLRVDMLGPAISPGSGSAGAGARPELRVADAVEPGDPDFETLLRAGFTTVLLSPDPVGPISGEVSAWKTGARSREDALLSPRAALVLRSDLRIDELRKAKDYRARREAFESERAKRARSGTPPERGSLKPPEKPPDHPPEKVAETLAGEPAQDQAEDLARDLAEDATETPAEQRAEKPTAEPPEKDDALEAFLPLLDRSIPAVVFAPSPEAMLPFARTLAKDFGIRVVAAPTGRADRIVAELKGLGAGLLLSVPLELIDEFETVHLPRAAASEGIRFAFRSGVAAGGAGLPAQVGLAVRAGWSSREALIAMTSAPAELFGIADRVGSIAEGRDADLVFLSDEPFAPTVRVLGVMTGGEMRFGAGDMVTREGIVNPAGGEDGR